MKYKVGDKFISLFTNYPFCKNKEYVINKVLNIGGDEYYGLKYSLNEIWWLNKKDLSTKFVRYNINLNKNIIVL